MKMLNAYTFEIDDVQVAIEEILEQLDLDNQLLANSAAFITCSYDFIETDAAKAICEALPLSVVGMTTLNNAINEESGSTLLCVSVVTADDCQFTTVCSDVWNEANTQEITAKACNEVLSNLDTEAKLILFFAPMHIANNSEDIIAEISNFFKNVPIFGSNACPEDVVTYENSFAIYNGDYLTKQFSMLIISGNINPRFIFSSLIEDHVSAHSFMVTESEGSVIKKINNMPAAEYLSSINVLNNNSVEGFFSTPLMADYNDGTQLISRAAILLDEDRNIVCGGSVPQGCKLMIGSLNKEDVRFIASQAIDKVAELDNVNGVIIFSCFGRLAILGLDYLLESTVIQEKIGDKVPFHSAYSAGEICPVQDQKENIINRFHNFTFIVCIL